MKKFFERRPHCIPAFIAAALLFAALAPWDDGYYRLLRLVTCAAAIFFIWGSCHVKYYWAVGPFAFIALLFNPLLPIHLTRDNWQIFDVVCGVVFLVVGFVPNPKQKGEETRNTEKDKQEQAKKLSKRELKVLWGGIILIVLMILVPPWQSRYGSFEGYGIIWSGGPFCWRWQRPVWESIPTLQVTASDRVKAKELEKKYGEDAHDDSVFKKGDVMKETAIQTIPASFPLEALSQLEARASITKYGELEVSVYNGSTWKIYELTVGLVIVRQNGTETSVRPYTLTPKYPSLFDGEPYKTTKFHERLGYSLASGESFRWWIKSVKAIPTTTAAQPKQPKTFDEMFDAAPTPTATAKPPTTKEEYGSELPEGFVLDEKAEPPQPTPTPRYSDIPEGFKVVSSPTATAEAADAYTYVRCTRKGRSYLGIGKGSLNLTVLLIQCIVVAILTGGIIFTMRQRSQP